MTTTLYVGDCLDVLPTLAAQSVQCCITSPAYWGLRDYGTATWVGGDPECEHKPGGASRVGKTTLGGGTATAGHQQEGYRDICGKCGAQRIDAQLGLEPTPDEYVCHLVAVFREVWRVLRDDGTLWLNLGDSFASGKGTCFNPGGGNNSLGQDRKAAGAHPLDRGNKSALTAIGLKPKDLVGIPWRMAFALQADGWYLRSDVIWHKPNPMPESVRDRPTRAHEYLFLLAKSTRYYYDADAIREPHTALGRPPGNKSRIYLDRDPQHHTGEKRRPGEEHSFHPNGRNRRDVWTIASKPYKGAHFATMPPDLVEPCVLAGCPVGGLVLDPFCGSGTVGMVAARLGRSFVGIDLNPAYAEMQRARIATGQREWDDTQMQPPLMEMTR